MAETGTNSALKLFGFEIKRARKEEEDKKRPSIVPPRDAEG